MKLKERIYHSIDTMNIHELTLLYEHIQLLEHMQMLTQSPHPGISIDTILEMTSSSCTSWAESVIEERREN